VKPGDGQVILQQWSADELAGNVVEVVIDNLQAYQYAVANASKMSTALPGRITTAGKVSAL
jgi:hypothetical protein